MASDRLLRLFQEQRGICWICRYPMLPPRGNGGNPNAFEATLDHLVERNTTDGQMRPAKAAHAKCNHTRHHDRPNDPKLIKHLIYMARRFRDTNFVQNILGVQQNERLEERPLG